MLKVLCAGLSKVSNGDVGEKVRDSKELNVANLHMRLFLSGPVYPKSLDTTKPFVKVGHLSGDDKNIELRFKRTDTIYQIKKAYCDATRTKIETVSLFYAGIKLDDIKCASDYKITEFSSIKVVSSTPARTHLAHNSFDDEFSYDFREKSDDGKCYTRGGEEYKRPLGYYRYALNVLNKYKGGNDWLTGSRDRGDETESAPDEWIISYHGTASKDLYTMAHDCYEMSRHGNFSATDGIYSTPNIKVAEEFGDRFKHDGEEYILIFQNRVNPKTVEKFGEGDKVYYFSENQDDVRPYGICIKKLHSQFQTNSLL